MRIESISESGSSPSTGNAFEQHASVRSTPVRRTADPAPSAPGGELVDVVDLRDSAAPTPVRPEVEFTAPRRTSSVGGEGQGIIDRNGNDRIDLGDLPFDYFLVSRQATRKTITPPATSIPF
jgi:hypothetical protein